ncbi:hypothetical protein RCO27_11375 [Sphingosinicella sp. LHD-64]|uniref:hypothetical protein n=1 Tax=Sphingosinicella sp. LHD-64 TaxID=3072139 RepID=UPI00280D7807|nr:hypothetical protein [Sphingosinicella sp. LHD-64]MDQ8756828.1 hypothetical protein [Sphingosinicella sp. LHD-64]
MNALNQTTTHHTRIVDEDQMARMEALLRRYPGLTDDETHALLQFVRNGPALELGLISGKDDLKPQLDRFRADHAKALSIGMREIAIIAALVIAVVVAVVLLWDAGGGR